MSSKAAGPSILSRPRARGLTLLSVTAMGLAPFSIPTFGVGIALGVFLIITSFLLTRQGYRARGPLLAGIISVGLGCASAGACAWFVLRTAEVTGTEEAHQDRVEDRFDRAFSGSKSEPQVNRTEKEPSARDAALNLDAQSPPTGPVPPQER